MDRARNLLGWRAPEWVTSAFLGLFTVVILTLEGLASVLYIDLYRGFGIDNYWPQRIHKFIHWHWTLPLSLLLASALIWKARVVSARRNRAIDLVTCLVVFATLGGWLWSACCIRITQ